MSGILPPQFKDTDTFGAPPGESRPIPLHLIDCMDGWDVDPDDGQKKPRRMMASKPCVCRDIIAQWRLSGS